MTAGRLPEVLEQHATGTIAETYADIRAVLGVPVVNLVYRHLAAQPGRLESIWGALRPNLGHPATHALAARLVLTADRVCPRTRPLTREDLAAAGISPGDWGRALATVAVYERANALNLLAGRALLDGSRGSSSAPPSAAPEDLPSDVLPMADLASLGERTTTTLNAISAAVTPEGGNTLVPSFFRHLASSPPLLDLIWSTVGQTLGSSATRQAGAIIHEDAARLATHLPRRVDPIQDPSVRAFLEWFIPTIATMLVTGRLLDATLSAASQ